MLSLICLIAAIFVLQPKQDICCQGLQQWLATSPMARANLRLPTTSPLQNAVTTDTTEENKAKGYVFSLVVGPSTTQSTLPDEATEPNENPSNPVNQEANTTIINTTEDLNLLPEQSQLSKKDPPIISKIFSQTNLVIALGLFVASFLQGASSFAFALLMIPLLVWNGFSLAEASIFTAINALAITSFMTFRLREYIKWDALWSPMFLRIGTMAVGIFLLALLTTLKKTLILQILGALLLAIVIIYIFVQVTVRRLARANSLSNETLNPAPHWSWLAFGTDGLFKGMIGFSGQIDALWVTFQNWSNKESRAFVAASYWYILPVQIILLFSTFGKALVQPSIQALYFLPIALVSGVLGFFFGKRWNETQLYYLVQFLLILIGIVSMLAPYLRII